MIDLICKICSISFKAYPVQVRKKRKYCSRTCYFKSKLGKPSWSSGKKGIFNMGATNGQWKGDKVGYGSLHRWVKIRFPKPKLCTSCNKRIAYDLANISQEYKRDLFDWEWLCRSCHMKKDGRLGKLMEHPKGNKYWVGRKRDLSGRFLNNE